MITEADIKSGRFRWSRRHRAWIPSATGGMMGNQLTEQELQHLKEACQAPPVEGRVILRLKPPLRPCPFCGNKELVMINCRVHCDCGCIGPESAASPYEAADLWNRRHGGKA